MTEIPEIFGWFPQANQDELVQLIEKHEIETALEIGTFLGRSAVWIAKRVQHLWCIDPFEESAVWPCENNLVETLRIGCFPNPFFDLFRSNMEAAGVWGKITAIRGRSEEVFWQVLEVDLVYIDGDHSYEGCSRDICLYLSKAKKVICGDDYHSDSQGVPYFPGVVQAVREAFPKHGSNASFWWKEL
jgi:predicted O-methyltransferase YrrM